MPVKRINSRFVASEQCQNAVFIMKNRGVKFLCFAQTT